MTLEDLSSTQVITFDSKPWWGENCPRLFDKTMQESLASQVQLTYQAISLSISGPVMDQQYLAVHRGPIDLKNQCEHYSGLTQLRIENDAVAWAKGATALQARLGSAVKYPGLFVTFGTSPGAAVLLDSTHSMGLELFLVDWPFPSTNACRKNQPESWDDHDRSLFLSSVINKETASAYNLLCTSSVTWICSQDLEKQQVQHIFTSRVSAFLHDITESLKRTLTIKVKTIFVGGGNAEWINNSLLSQSIPESVHVLNNTALKTHKISPNLISLMGAIVGICEISTTTVFPEKSRLQAQMKALHEEYSKTKSL